MTDKKDKEHDIDYADPEEEQVDDFDAGVLQIMDLEAPAILRLFAPVLPIRAVAKLLQLITGGCDVVVEPLARH